MQNVCFGSLNCQFLLFLILILFIENVHVGSLAFCADFAEKYKVRLTCLVKCRGSRLTATCATYLRLVPVWPHRAWACFLMCKNCRNIMLIQKHVETSYQNMYRGPCRRIFKKGLFSCVCCPFSVTSLKPY